MDQIGLFFKCQSCSDYVLSNNIQCPNGHQVCQACFENLSYCPTCHQRVAPSTRIPFLLTTNVDPILNVGESFDLLLPSLLRIAPAIHPCSPDEMIITDNPSSLILNSSSVNINNNDSSMQKNNNLADQLLIANSCEVEETLSRLMMLASMSPGPTHSTSGADNDTVVQQPPPPGLMNSSKPFPTSAAAAAAAAASVEPSDWSSSVSATTGTNTTAAATTTPTDSQQAPQKQQVDEYPEF